MFMSNCLSCSINSMIYFFRERWRLQDYIGPSDLLLRNFAWVLAGLCSLADVWNSLALKSKGHWVMVTELARNRPQTT